MIKDKQREQLRRMIRLVADAAEKTPPPNILEFFEREALKLPLDLVHKTLNYFAEIGKFPTLAGLKQKMGYVHVESEAFKPRENQTQTFREDFEIGESGIALAEMPYDSSPNQAESFFDAKIRLLESKGYKIGSRKRYQGDVVLQELVNGKTLESKRFQLKEHIEVERVSLGNENNWLNQKAV